MFYERELLIKNTPVLTTLEHSEVLTMKLNEIADQLLDIANGIEYNNISYFNPLLVSVQNKAKPDDLLLAIAVSIKNDITNGKLPSPGAEGFPGLPHDGIHLQAGVKKPLTGSWSKWQ